MTLTSQESLSPQRMRVRTWFGGWVIADYRVKQSLAERYAAATQRRFGLRTTINPVAVPGNEPRDRADVVTSPTPVMLGYLVKSIFMTPVAENRARWHLLGVADQQGCRMPEIFVEQADTESSALRELIQAARRDGGKAVAIVGVPELRRRHRKELATAEVELVFTTPPP